MSEEQQDNKVESSTNIVPPPITETSAVPPVENIVNDISQIPETKPPETEKEQINKEPVQVIVNIPKDENKAATTANKIAIVGTVINLALAGLTYLLFQKTIEANKTSQSSLVEAQKAVDQAKRANDIAEANFKLAQISSASNDSINNINLTLTKKSVGAQVNSITESQRQFEKINMPYLQCDEFIASSMEINKRPKITYKIFNLGNYPAKILDRKLGYFFEKITPKEPSKKADYSKFSNSFEIYINKEVPKVEIFNGEETLNAATYNSYTNGSYRLHYFGDILYENEANGKKRLYSFYIYFFPPPSTEYKTIYNKNIDIN